MPSRIPVRPDGPLLQSDGGLWSHSGASSRARADGNEKIIVDSAQS